MNIEQFIYRFTGKTDWKDIEKLKFSVSEVMDIAEKFSSQLEPHSYTAAVLAEYEDELPDYITEEDYERMFPLSKVDIVRTFPYVEINGHKYYLKAV